MVTLQIEQFGDGILEKFGALGFIIIILGIVLVVLYKMYLSEKADNKALQAQHDVKIISLQAQHDREVEALQVKNEKVVEALQKRNNEISDKAMELMTRVSDKMPSLERIGNLERNHVDILKALDEILKKIDK